MDFGEQAKPIAMMRSRPAPPALAIRDSDDPSWLPRLLNPRTAGGFPPRRVWRAFFVFGIWYATKRSASSKPVVMGDFGGGGGGDRYFRSGRPCRRKIEAGALMSDENRPTIAIRQRERFKFEVDFGDAVPALLVDEAPPVGDGDGPFPEQLLALSVANCLCASLVFALGKFRQDASGVEARASCLIDRNPEGRLRISGIDVDISLGAVARDLDRIDRVIEQFERFCTVTESVKAGLPVRVSVRDGEGRKLK